jgi:hypothetical protein
MEPAFPVTDQCCCVAERCTNIRTGIRPAITSVTAGNAARSHSPSEVISKMRVASVSQPKAAAARSHAN